MTTLSALTELQLPSVAFYGRTLAEYARFFALDLPALAGRSVLDVAAGPASFTAEAGRRGIEAVAVDPLYGCSRDTLSAYVTLDYQRMQAQMRARPQLLQCGPVFSSVEEAISERRRAAEGFLQDYESGFLQGRYVGGALPQLPFPEGRFDLVLCAHLLFVYARQLDLGFHLTACAELVRVSRGEVRIHPLCGLDGRPYPELEHLRRDLEDRGIASEVRPVDYAFFAGADSQLVLQRQ